MPARSKSQQRLFGMVHAYQKGKLKDAPEEVKSIARSISSEDAEHFAKTKHKGLPEKKAYQDYQRRLEMVHKEAYERGFMDKCAEYGVDPEALVERTTMQKSAIGFDLARRVAQRFASGRWNSTTAKRLMERILNNPPRGDIGHLGGLPPDMQRRILSQVSLKPETHKYLSGLETTLRDTYRPTARGVRDNEFLMLLSDLAERPLLHAEAVSRATSPASAMAAVKRIVPSGWKDMRDMSERLFDALSRG